jgi:hypothetical protein
LALHDDTPEGNKRVLEPIERISEILFGLIMVLTFTGSLSAAESGQAEIKAMLIGAIGCNLAWALIDAIMYLMNCLSERARGFKTFAAMRSAQNPQEARVVIGHVVPPLVAGSISDAELDRIRNVFSQMPKSPRRGTLQAHDFIGALGVFLLVFISTFPVVLPFLFFEDAMTALRVSNAIAILLMFLTGFAFGKLSGYQPFLTGGTMVVLGAILVSLTIALGG